MQRIRLCTVDGCAIALADEYIEFLGLCISQSLSSECFYPISVIITSLLITVIFFDVSVMVQLVLHISGR
jgi:hypothetical protein